AHETVRPMRTSAAAAVRFAGVIEFSVPSWSRAPQRPQFDSVWWNAATAAADSGARGSGMATSCATLLRSTARRQTSRMRSGSGLGRAAHAGEEDLGERLVERRRAHQARHLIG